MPSREDNKRHWNTEHDWADLGEVWTQSDHWKRAIIDQTLDPFVKPGMTVVEIGPGGGRWTVEILARGVGRLVLVDLAEKCLELCRQRFAGRTGIEYHCNDGRSLPFLRAGEVDLVWSFDVFVHIDKPDTEAYFAEFARVLRPGGLGMIHYASIDRAPAGNNRRGWRADYTSADMRSLIARLGFELIHDHYDPDIAANNSSLVLFRRP
ncbi:MAG: class I SAM-dependent methyltransferase [Planctomycetes bacterium]|nr:class I SAM-dependent methyltransferase [Planctomycetota bacterium]